MEIHRHMHLYEGLGTWGAIVSLVDDNGLYRLGEVVTECTNRDEAQLAIDILLQGFLDGAGDEFIAWSGGKETLQ